MLAAVPVLAALTLGLLIITAAGTAPDLAPPQVSGEVETAPGAPSAGPSAAPETSEPESSTTLPTTAAPTTQPALVPATAPPSTGPPVTPPTAPPVAPPTAPVSAGPPSTVTVRIRYDDVACGGAVTSVAGCVRSAATIGVVTSSGARTSTGPASSLGPGLREIVATLQVRAEATQWDIRVGLDYVGPCGPSPVDAVRYHLAVSAAGDVRLFAVNGSSGSLRRPQPSDRAWVATIHPARFPAPEPGCA